MGRSIHPGLLLEVEDLHMERVSEKNDGRKRCYVCDLPCGAVLSSRAAGKKYQIPVHRQCAEQLGVGSP